MATEGCDYSWSRPDPACLAARGITFAGRYSQPDDRPKSMSYEETARLEEVGIALVTIYQPSGDKGWMLHGGADRGKVAARESLSIAERLCGMPDDRPIYYALDVDPRPLTAVQWDMVRRLLDGAAVVTGPNRVGIYGGWLAMEKLIPGGHARWGYQTKSWSVYDQVLRWHPDAQLQQYAHNMALCGGQIDYVRAVAADYGGWDDP
jgi:hypothetical protein